MNKLIPDLIAWKRGFESGRDVLEKDRIKRIRESDIVTSLPAFELVFSMAKEKLFPKPLTGLVELRKILSKINR